MANPTEVGVSPDRRPAIVEAVTTAAMITLDPDLFYQAQHNGIDAAGSAATTRINLSVGDVTPADTAGAGKMTLVTGQILGFGPGFTKLNYKATANSPTFTLVPGEKSNGQF